MQISLPCAHTTWHDIMQNSRVWHSMAKHGSIWPWLTQYYAAQQHMKQASEQHRIAGHSRLTFQGAQGGQLRAKPQHV